MLPSPVDRPWRFLLALAILPAFLSPGCSRGRPNTPPADRAGADAPHADTPERHEFARLCMGVETRIILYANDRAQAVARAAMAFERINELDHALSDYRLDSTLSRVNAAAGAEPVAVDDDLFDALRTSMHLAALSNGAFDPTIGPLVQVWRVQRRTGQPAPAGEQRSALALVNWRDLDLNAQTRTAFLRRKGMRLDLGGIGKGIAAQEAVRTLTAMGSPRCMVSLAGDIAAGLPPPDQPRGWRIEVRSGAEAPPIGTLWLAQMSVSTSGDSEQFIELDGVRLGHIIDPRSGRTSAPGAFAVVVSSRGDHADALATTLLLTPADQRESLLLALADGHKDDTSRAGAIIEEPSPDSPSHRGRSTIDPFGVLRWAP
ncbi:MAG: FAD:protein FMN transferase [Phycisphaeraceae bacterium]|nr:FAD:protein FMN transferase [Phycisphaeraceae bacterium]